MAVLKAYIPCVIKKYILLKVTNMSIKNVRIPLVFAVKGFTNYFKALKRIAFIYEITPK